MMSSNESKQSSTIFPQIKQMIQGMLDQGQSLEDIAKVSINLGIDQAQLEALVGSGELVQGRLNQAQVAAIVTEIELEPKEMTCPLTLALMEVPVIASDGHTYEQSVIAMHMAQVENPVSPISRKPFENKDLIENHALRGKIIEYRESVIRKVLEVVPKFTEQRFFDDANKVLQVAFDYAETLKEDRQKVQLLLQWITLFKVSENPAKQREKQHELLNLHIHNNQFSEAADLVLTFDALPKVSALPPLPIVILQQLKDQLMAKEVSQEALALMKKIGEELRDKGDIQASKAAFTEAVTYRPDVVDGYHWLAQLVESESAKGNKQVASTIATDLAQLHLNVNQLDQTEHFLIQALDLFVTNKSAMNQLEALADRFQGQVKFETLLVKTAMYAIRSFDHKNASRLLLKALTQNPHNGDAYTQFLNLMGQPFFQKEDGIQSYSELGTIMLKSGQFDKAEHAYKMAIQQDSSRLESYTLLRGLAEALKENGDPENAIRLLMELHQRYEAIEQLPLCEIVLKEVLGIDPSHGEAHTQLISVLDRERKTSEAAKRELVRTLRVSFGFEDPSLVAQSLETVLSLYENEKGRFKADLLRETQEERKALKATLDVQVAALSAKATKVDQERQAKKLIRRVKQLPKQQFQKALRYLQRAIKLDPMVQEKITTLINHVSKKGQQSFLLASIYAGDQATVRGLVALCQGVVQLGSKPLQKLQQWGIQTVTPPVVLSPTSLQILYGDGTPINTLTETDAGHLLVIHNQRGMQTLDTEGQPVYRTYAPFNISVTETLSNGNQWLSSGNEFQMVSPQGTVLAHVKQVRLASVQLGGRVIGQVTETENRQTKYYIKVWDMNGQETTSFPYPNNQLARISLVGDDKVLVTIPGRSYSHQILDFEGKSVKSLPGHQDVLGCFSDVITMQQNSSGNITMYLFSPEGESLGSLPALHYNIGNYLGYLEGRQQLVTSHTDGTLKFWNKSGEEVGSLQAYEAVFHMPAQRRNARIERVVELPGGQLLGVGPLSKENPSQYGVRIWSQAGELLSTIPIQAMPSKIIPLASGKILFQMSDHTVLQLGEVVQLELSSSDSDYSEGESSADEGKDSESKRGAKPLFSFGSAAPARSGSQSGGFRFGAPSGFSFGRTGENHK